MHQKGHKKICNTHEQTKDMKSGLLQTFGGHTMHRNCLGPMTASSEMIQTSH